MADYWERSCLFQRYMIKLSVFKKKIFVRYLEFTIKKVTKKSSFSHQVCFFTSGVFVNSRYLIQHKLSNQLLVFESQAYTGERIFSYFLLFFFYYIFLLMSYYYLEKLLDYDSSIKLYLTLDRENLDVPNKIR